ncbi:MAG: NTP transferase domain-containing protein, partial [Bacteroidota bacterium]|nr:NTP transferase domain-containing protein [Bacteroidota bacterium]
MPTSNPAVVILAAGQGKRMKRPDLPKVLHPLAGEPLIDHVIRLARSVDPCRIIVVVGHGRDLLIRHLRSRQSDVEIAVQAEQLGTAHAVLQTRPLLEGFEGDIAILSGDA